MEISGHVLFVGIGATAMLDLWSLGLKRAGLPAMNMAMLGRWVGHMPQGRFVHISMAQAMPVPGELWLGWLVHYATGVAFAMLWRLLSGPVWAKVPTLWPALGFGLVSVALPFLVMQPMMGAGFASLKTATPRLNILKSLSNHLVFGLGLYLCALGLTLISL